MTSFRDRLKWPTGKAAPTIPQPPQQEEAPKTRAAYRPKHAASDFSLLTAPVVPRRITSLEADPNALPSLPSPPPQIVPPERTERCDRPPVRADRPVERAASGVDTVTLTRDVPQANPATSPIERRPSHAEPRAARAPEGLYPVQTRSSSGGKSRSSGGDTTLATAQAALRIPINTAHVVWNLDPEGTDLEPPSHPEQPQATKHKGRDLSPPSVKPTQAAAKQTQPLTSDFELFLARAEAQDRQHREEVWKTIAAAATAASAPPPTVRPSPHQQFASNNGLPRPRDLSHRSSAQQILPWASSAREQEPLFPRGSHRDGVNHRTYRQGLNGKASMGSMSACVSGENGEGGRTPRETSIAQKIVEYIRPPRETGVLYHSGSRASMRRAGGHGVRNLEKVEE